jgi:hypothetical protein
MIAGIDYSTKAIDIVLLDEDSDAATWHHYPLRGGDAFDRARDVGRAVPGRAMTFWDDILAVGLEEPRGYNAGALYRIQGAVLACVPAARLVQPWIPSAWRNQVGLPGNASKETIHAFVHTVRGLGVLEPAPAGGFMMKVTEGVVWPQDACDAYCLALATRSLIRVAAGIA